MNIISSGIIKYDPHRPGLKKKTEWWATMIVDEDISRLCRWWVFNELHIELKKPSWGTHVSIIRGEKPALDKLYLWKKYDGKKLNFKYSLDVRQSGDTTGFDRPNHYWFVDVDCPQLIDIREEFGFPSDWKLHMTIGRTW